MKQYFFGAIKTVPYLVASALALIAVVAFGRYALHRQTSYYHIDSNLIAQLSTVKSEAIRIGIPITKEMQRGPSVSESQNAANLYQQFDDMLASPPLGKDQKLIDTTVDSVTNGAAVSDSSFPGIDSLLDRHKVKIALVHEIVKRPENEMVIKLTPSQAAVQDSDETDESDDEADKKAEKDDDENESKTEIAARLLSLESMQMLHQGRLREAIANQSSLFVIAHHCVSWSAGDGSVTSYRVLMIALDGLQAILSVGAKDGFSKMPDAPDRILALCRQHRNDFDIGTAIKFEAGSRASHLEDPQYRRMLPMLDRFSDSHGAMDPSALMEQDPQAAAQWNAKADEVECLVLQRAIRTLGRLNEPFGKELADIREIMPRPTFSKPIHFDITAEAYLPIDYLTTCQAYLRASFATTIAAAQILKMQRTTGSFPSSLDQIGMKTPMDPFTDKPLGYKRTGDGFVVYSAGPDGNYQGDKTNANSADSDRSIEEFRYTRR